MHYPFDSVSTLADTSASDVTGPNHWSKCILLATILSYILNIKFILKFFHELLGIV